MAKQAEYSFKELTDVVKFGINKGMTIGDIMKTNPKYIDWCINNFKGFKLYKKLASEFEEIKRNA